MVLVIGVLGAWGKGKTLTLTMLQELAKYKPKLLGLSEPCIIVSNYMSKFVDYIIAVKPHNREAFNPYTKKNVGVLDLEEFLSRPIDGKNYFLFLDDVYSWLASWYFSSQFNTMALRLLASGRKKNINIAVSSTRWKDIDVRLRVNHTHLIFPTFIPEKNVCKIEINLIGINDLIPLQTLYFNAKRYFDAYDTKEIIEPIYPTKTKIKTVVRTNGHTITQSEQLQPEQPSKDENKTILESRKPDGYEALAKGILIQQQIADEYKKQGYIVECKFGDKEPDIILYEDENKTKPIKVVSVKSFYLVPSNQRWTATPLPDGSNGRRQGFATTRMVYRRDILPEIEYALEHNVPLELVLVNQRNMKRETIVLEGMMLKNFQKIASSQKLNQDKKEEEEKEKEKKEEDGEEDRGVAVDRVGGVFKINVSKAFDFSAKLSNRTIEVSEAFGVGIDESKKFKVYDNFVFDLCVGDVIYITGDSGSGKSLLLKILKEELSKIPDFGKIVDLKDVIVDDDEVLVEGVGQSFEDAVKILSFVGLNEAFLFLRKFKELSDGQKYRYKLAKLLDSGGNTLIVDEFCSLLDRDTAKVISFLYQKICREFGKTLIVATAHTDLLWDLNPDVYIHKRFGQDVEYKRFKPEVGRKCSLYYDIVIEEGSKDDYIALEDFHYRASAPPFVKAIYRARLRDEIVGVIVYVTPHMNLRARNIVLPMYGGKRDKIVLEQINNEIERIARVIVLPKYRGIGIATKLVKETMPLRNKPYIEALAVMGRYNPFFEKAGMFKVEVGLSENWLKTFRELEMLGFDVNLMSSVNYNISVINSLDENSFNRLKQIVLSEFAHQKFKSYDKEKIVSGDIEEIARVLAEKPLNTAYFIWKNPEFKDYPDPIIPENIIGEDEDERDKYE